MVGANCSIFGCSSSRTQSGVAIFKVTQEDDEWSFNWRKSIISVVTKDSIIDKALRERIMKKYSRLWKILCWRSAYKMYVYTKLTVLCFCRNHWKFLVIQGNRHTANWGCLHSCFLHYNIFCKSLNFIKT